MTTTAPQPPGRAGRPSLLDEERAQRIIDAVRAGNYMKVAAQWAGISERTLLSWLARGRAAQAAVDEHDPAMTYCPECGALYAEHDGSGSLPLPHDYRCGTCGTTAAPRVWALPDAEARYLHFLHEVTRAETAAEVAAVTAWRSAFSDDWRAARDWLTHGRARDRWTATTRVMMNADEAERRIDGALDEAVAALDLDDGPDLDPVLDGDLAEAIGTDGHEPGLDR